MSQLLSLSLCVDTKYYFMHTLKGVGKRILVPQREIGNQGYERESVMLHSWFHDAIILVKHERNDFLLQRNGLEERISSPFLFALLILSNFLHSHLPSLLHSIPISALFLSPLSLTSEVKEQTENVPLSCAEDDGNRQHN